MKENNITILTTRPLARTTMEMATDAGVTIDTATLIETHSTIDHDIAEEVRKYATEEIAVVFTSMNAVEAIMDVLEVDGINPEWTIYSMGGTTQQLIKSYFVESELVATATNSTELAETIIENEEQEVVFFCGNQRMNELPGMLQQNDIVLNEIIVYETVELPVKITTPYNGILFFSPSAVRSFFAVNNLPAETVLFAIGKTTAEAIKKVTNNTLIIGDFPNKEQLAEKAVGYFLSK